MGGESGAGLFAEGTAQADGAGHCKIAGGVAAGLFAAQCFAVYDEGSGGTAGDFHDGGAREIVSRAGALAGEDAASVIAKRNGGGNGNDNGNDNGKKQKHGSEDLPLQRQTEAGFAALGVGAIFQGEFAAVGFGDLAAEYQANAGAAAFSGEEGDEEVGGVG